MKRTYDVIAKFKITGDLAPMIVKEHIKGKLESKLEDLHIALHGEYYGDYDEEWEMYVDGNVSLKIKPFEEVGIKEVPVNSKECRVKKIK